MRVAVIARLSTMHWHSPRTGMDEPIHSNIEQQPPTVDADLQRLEEEASQSIWKERRQVLWLACGVAAFMAVAHFTPLKGWITNVQQWKQYLDEFGWPAHAGFMAAAAVAVMFGVPRLPLCGMAGMLFGFGEGLAISLLGTVMGSYGAFLMARHGARRLTDERSQRWPWLKKLLEAPSLLRVLWVRQLMVPGVVLNVLFGMTAISHRTFITGTLLGYLPLNIAFTLVGSGLGKESLAQSLTQVITALVVVNVLGWVVWKIVETHRLRSQPM